MNTRHDPIRPDRRRAADQRRAEGQDSRRAEGRDSRRAGGPGYGPRLLRRAGAASGLVLGATLTLYPLTLYPLALSEPVSSSPLPTLLGLLLGLPHGAVDHLVPGWLGSARRLPVRLAVLLGYAGTAGAALCAFLARPAAALLGFLVLSVVHFGAGDEAFRAEREGVRPRLRPFGVLAYGGPPVVLPLALWPEQVDPLLERVAAGSTALLTAEVRAGALLLTALAITVTALRDLARGRRGDVAQLGVLTAVFVVVPPTCAFGVYFAAWHSLRHVARLLAADPANAACLREGRLAPALWRFARQAALPTGIVLVSFALLVWYAGPAGTLPAAFAVLAALTLPHALVVAWLDRHRPGGPRDVDRPARPPATRNRR
ncbi:hypothetical protein GCM10022225_04480 [Plantactinospora mayteni]|uniref:Probable beta-carotene 15,15'-dioxygenase n=1 Tax=Plantactinospora mayteni TaxID=566021 RepID=A0ABQ4EQJ1_9ACTN|nr:Brp/Blh family beta-carotene 15,15'-dioxygenase [Plantactinospora mayteni]GIG96937.1 hypothetical protein Pma05_35100 [Plantactinospora mayteni]